MPNRSNRQNKSSHNSYKRKASKKGLSRVQTGRHGIHNIIYTIENVSREGNENFSMSLNISASEARKVKKYLKKMNYDYNLFKINNHYKLFINW